MSLSGNIRCRLDPDYVPEIRKCKRCGKEFHVYQTENASNPSKFCSRECCAKEFNAQKLNKQSLVSRTMYCKVCGKSFTPSKYHRIYCSVECRSKNTFKYEKEK